ncbi:beta family protein [Couchioplanes caeruleus]|uniref:T4 beta protein n=1 Tax=Couchioplanes caeruleus TaxID=56438 RepID=A0A3N1GI33_9ACTN|nr:beta family protein [Couchioplanes caeruleus]ROP29920.1 T4 beta protein [Couchioplanes caeruleus]
MTVFTGPEAADDGVYRPILRPRRGELAALHHLDAAAARRVTPIIEAAPSERLLPLVRQLPPRTGAIAVDLGAVPDSADRHVSPPLDLAEALAALGVAMLPVLRAYDSRRRLIENGLAARMHLMRAVLRLQPHIDARNAAEATATTDRMLAGAGLEAERVDLLIDLAETACAAHADRFEDRARHVLRWARATPWRSVTVAAGAMPPNLDDLPTDEPVTVGRLDARMWARLCEPGVGYADYGVTSPVRRNGINHRQLPTLRYTAERDWWIYRWARRGGRSDDRCHDLCRTLVQSPHWPAAGARFSWGDAEIARRARSARGGGSPASWMAWSTSHHIAHVLAHLTRL